MDAKTLMSILNTSTGRCWSSEMYNPVPGMLPNVPSSNGYKVSFVLHHFHFFVYYFCKYFTFGFSLAHQGGFGVALIAKDLGLAQNVATQSGIPIPMGAQAHQMYRMMQLKKLGDKDLAVAYQYLQDESS